MKLPTINIRLAFIAANNRMALMSISQGCNYLIEHISHRKHTYNRYI